MPRLYHVSEESGIRRFEPRSSASFPQPVVWAVEAARLTNYLLPRECPRVTFHADTTTTPADCHRFGLQGAASSVVAIEPEWADRVRSGRVFLYNMPVATFRLTDAVAGYWISEAAIVPDGVEVIEDLWGAIEATGAEIRIVEPLRDLAAAVAASSLLFSIIRLRNARPEERRDRREGGAPSVQNGALQP